MALVPLRSHGTACTRARCDVRRQTRRLGRGSWTIVPVKSRTWHLSGTDWDVKRKGRSRPLRRFVWRVVLTVILLGVVIPAVIGPVVGIMAGLIALPFVVIIAVLALMLLLLGLAIAGAVAAGIIGVPAWFIWRASRPKDENRERQRTPELPEDVLKRRYLAGNLTHLEYRDEMLAILKGQFARGDIDVNDYEAEVEHLIRASQNADRRLRRSRALDPDEVR